MREKRTTQKKPSNEPKHKPITKASPKPKTLKYKPAKGDESKNWVVQNILNERIILMPISELNSPKNSAPENSQKSQTHTNIFKNYYQIKEYEIAWAQSRQQGIWPNTWQPQQNIPVETRLDYLLKKANKLNEKKNKNSSHQKTKLNLQKHIDFTMNRMEILQPRAATVQQKSSKQILNPSIQKSPSKSNKHTNYKKWFYSFSSKTDEYDKMIRRSIRLQKNPKSATKQISQTKSQKLHNLKGEFIESIKSIKEQKKQDDVSQLFHKSQKIPHNVQNTKEYTNFTEFVPQKICLKLVKDIAYIGQVDNVNLLLLKYDDGSFKFIRQDDIVKYLPWIYEKLMKKTIDEELKEFSEKLAQMSIEKYYQGGKCLEELSYQIGIPRNYFWELQKQQRNRTNRCYASSYKNQPYTAQNDFFFSFENSSSMGQQKFQVNHFEEQNLNETAKQIENLHLQKISQIQKCFNFLSQKSFEDGLLMNKLSLSFHEAKQKINDNFKSIDCKQLFSSTSHLLNEWKTSKSQIQFQKLGTVKKENRNQSVKLQNSFESKQKKKDKYYQKSKSTMRMQNTEQKEDSFQKIIKKRETIEITEDSNKSLKKVVNADEKIPHKKVKLTDDDEIKSILGLMQAGTRRKNEEFYDSEQESSNK